MSTELFAYLPRLVIQAPLLAVADICIGSITKRIGGSFEIGILMSATNWFMFYCGVRTYSNSVEGSLLAISLALWPIGHNEVKKSKIKLFNVGLAVFLGAMSIVLRPSSIITWLFLGTYFLFHDIGIFETRTWKILLFTILPIVLSVFVVDILVEKHFYGEWTLIFKNFYEFNVVRGLSSLYGTHRLHWYFIECMPAILAVQLPLFVQGLQSSFKNGHKTPAPKEAELRTIRYRLLGLALCHLIILSLSPHKELRFAYPTLNITLPFCAIGYDQVTNRVKKYAPFVPAVLLLGFLLPALYLSLIHQRAATDVITHVTSRFDGHVDFLVPCHATPLWSFAHPVHSKVTQLSFLDCSPHIDELRRHAYLNTSFGNSEHLHETQQFKNDPKGFTLRRYLRGYDSDLPTVIVTGSKFDKQVELALQELRLSYVRCGEFAHANEDDIGKSMFLFCLKD